MILSIDPGNTESAFVVVDEKLKPIWFDKVDNEDLLEMISADDFCKCLPAVEMVASYGMAVGKEVFETCLWIGRFIEALERHASSPTLVYRKDEKMALCGSMKAKDSNIRQALIDRFGEVGTKKNPGWFYGFKGDIWQAYAVAVTYHDLYLKAVKTA
jgi:hypothetical protein